MKMRHRKTRRFVVIEYGVKGIQRILGGKMKVLMHDIVGHDDHNSWDYWLIARYKH